jgi:hypothetical protein
LELFQLPEQWTVQGSVGIWAQFVQEKGGIHGADLSYHEV